MLKVEIQGYRDLSDLERMGAADNGSGKEWACYLRVTHNGETLFLENDACEPEDKTFSRDLSWVRDAILRAYDLGKADGYAETSGD